jgi:hypothetical protein
MKHLMKARPSPAMVVALIALFVSLGGTAAALSGSNTVFTDDIANDTQPAGGGNPAGGLRAADLRAGSVGSSEVANNSLTGADTNESQLEATPLRTRVAQGGCGTAVAGTGEMVGVGPFCIDQHENSVWTQPTGGTQLTTDAKLDAACPDNGQPSGTADCEDFYARSVSGVEPARRITWFQAQQALANSGKRLPTNAEWQAAVSGTPDSRACNVSTSAVQNTGANAGCVSRFGVFDMVGNVWEWVADWDEEAFACTSWPAGFGSDITCVGRGSGEASSRFPGALIRGGDFNVGTDAGPFAVNAGSQPSDSVGGIGVVGSGIGFRGAR